MYTLEHYTPHKVRFSVQGQRYRKINCIRRPNQTPQSWGIARLASAVTGGKAAAVDYKIIEEGCDHKKRAFTLANKTRKSYTSRTH